jgi:hypothetical protein
MGSGELVIAAVIFCSEETRPPGVSMESSTKSARSSAARAMARST